MSDQGIVGCNCLLRSTLLMLAVKYGLEFGQPFPRNIPDQVFLFNVDRLTTCLEHCVPARQTSRSNLFAGLFLRG